MTAPAKSRGRRSAPATRPRASATETVEQAPDVTEPDATPSRRGSRGRTSAAERAYARRAQRADLLQREQLERPDALEKAAPRKFKLSWPKSRASFVLMMMGLLAAGVATTLWLSTQAIADSYRLEQLRTHNASLAEAKEKLQREVTKNASASSLAELARQQGMVPGGDPARIVVGPDGSTTLVGDPKKAQGDVPAAQAPPEVPAAAGTQQGAPIEGDQPAVPAEAQGGQ
ncbi:hypothetical protein [Amycolatopsis sp. H20-H5]|uniref:hypothetical protein n=1 Tax=Amycolatopsis sp. H20-H5 TaxID=3046309 RepID=UPI002DC01292|nr:hypothetical protein [Amycolatopsis sp. H20-H5]MEC3977662.1 hypothetical protein [Amycolatopsis sp. H20-H5]